MNHCPPQLCKHSLACYILEEVSAVIVASDFPTGERLCNINIHKCWNENSLHPAMFIVAYTVMDLFGRFRMHLWLYKRRRRPIIPTGSSYFLSKEKLDAHYYATGHRPITRRERQLRFIQSGDNFGSCGRLSNLGEPSPSQDRFAFHRSLIWAALYISTIAHYFFFKFG
jgi:hypothetical protein